MDYPLSTLSSYGLLTQLTVTEIFSCDVELGSNQKMVA